MVFPAVIPIGHKKLMLVVDLDLDEEQEARHPPFSL